LTNGLCALATQKSSKLLRENRLNLTPASWQLWCFALLALALVIAIEADFFEQRIPNLLVGLVIVAGVALNVAGPANGQEGMLGEFPGALGGTQAVFGVLVGLALFLPLYMVGAMGAGDVKLLAAIGSFTGPVEVVGVAVFVAACGGLLALGLTVARHKSRQAWANMVLIFNSAMGTGVAGKGFDATRQTALRMPYALAFGLGVSAYVYWRQSGHSAWVTF
jgi:prepilin peptidase CpaA